MISTVRPDMARGLRLAFAGLVLALSGAAPLAASSRTGEEDAPAAGVVRVGMLVYGEDEQTGVCFADDFLDTLARETHMRLHRAFEPVKLASDELFDYPFVVMTGQRAFTLSDAEREQLRQYVLHGGFVLASAGCSSERWAESFRETMNAVFDDAALEPIDLDHPLFHTVYDIDYLDVRGSDEASPPLFASRIGDAVRVVFSPMGLNDTANAGDGCCCCGGNEVRNARLINANILAYALTH
ncbi:MAG: DUF4159 domain-containing protein [Phycisphaeraceae bacterium]